MPFGYVSIITVDIITPKALEGKKLAKQSKKADMQESLTFGYALHVTANYHRLAVTKFIKNKPQSSLTIKQLAILIVLTEEDGLYQMQIAQALSKNRPNMARLLSILEKQGYIERRKDEKNKKILRVFITEAGRNIVKKLASVRKEFHNTSLAGISEEDLKVTCKVLKKVKDNLMDEFKLNL